MQSDLRGTAFRGLHIACIMDGNGRWATLGGRPRRAGHRAGVEAVRKVVEAAPGLGIGTLTLYAFSSDNWKRPEAEVRALMRLLRIYVRAEQARLVRAGVRLTFIGRRDRLADTVQSAMATAEHATRDGGRLHLRIAVDYSARDSICEAARRWMQTAPDSRLTPSREEFSACLEKVTQGNAAPKVDLLIRTGGEQRLSDFLLWESAYAELLFFDTLWPDMNAEALRRAVAVYHTRNRRFGALPVQPSPNETHFHLLPVSKSQEKAIMNN